MEPKKISFKAILIGSLVDIVGSIFIGISIMIAVGLATAIQGVNYLDFIRSFEMRIIVFFIGTLITILSGYVAGRISKFKEVKHALFVGIISEVMGIIDLISGPSTLPSWYIISSIVVVIPAAMLGGYWAKILNERNRDNS